MIPSLEPRESVLRSRSGEIIAFRFREVEKLLGQHSANHMVAVVVGSGLAVTVSVETC